jgi:hypothetical protein
VELQLSQTRIIQEKIEEGGALFLATYFNMENACMFFLSENESRLGTLAVALPQKQKIIGPPLSSILLGDRNMMIARILAERLASKMNTIALVSIFIKTVNEREAGPILLRLLEKTLRKGGVEE